MAQNSGYGGAGMGFIDGAYMPVSEMRLPITDMGFQLGDMCYDAIHVHKGSFFRLKDHLDRWENSVSERRYTSLGYDREQVAEILHGCVARGNLRESMITFVATRGSPSTAHKDLRTCNNRFMVWALPYYKVVSDEELADGSDIVIANTIRIPPEAVDPHVKNFGRLTSSAPCSRPMIATPATPCCSTDDNVTGVAAGTFSRAAGVLPDSGVPRASRGRRWSSSRPAQHRLPAGQDACENLARGRRGVHHLDGRRDHAGAKHRWRAGRGRQSRAGDDPAK